MCLYGSSKALDGKVKPSIGERKAVEPCIGIPVSHKMDFKLREHTSIYYVFVRDMRGRDLSRFKLKLELYIRYLILQKSFFLN